MGAWFILRVCTLWFFGLLILNRVIVLAPSVEVQQIFAIISPAAEMASMKSFFIVATHVVLKIRRGPELLLAVRVRAFIRFISSVYS